MFDLNSAEWRGTLCRGLRAENVLIQCVARNVVLSIFQAGPFRLAYPDFPTGVKRYSCDELGAIIAASRTGGVDVLRVHSREMLSTTDQHVRQSIGTMLIPALSDWDESKFEKARRTRNRAVTTPIEISAMDTGDEARLYDLYFDTIARSSGSARYNQSYFASLPRETVRIARFEGKVVGFVCFGHRGSSAYYLHGAYSQRARAHHPSDLLFLTMLRAARDAGASELDFLPSPSAQPQLERYKRAWGAQPAGFFVSDFPLRPFRARAFSTIRTIADRLPASWIRKVLMR